MVKQFPWEIPSRKPETILCECGVLMYAGWDHYCRGPKSTRRRSWEEAKSRRSHPSGRAKHDQGEN
jgi:hypothetical protein